MENDLDVIVIDDQPSILESMEMFFGLRGWNVHTAINGHEGLSLIERIRPALVVLDIRLPGISGLDVLETVSHRFPDIPVIMITAYQSMESTIQAIKLGAFDYIHKPIDISEMDAVLQRLEQVASASRESDMSEAASQIPNDGSHTKIVAKSRRMKEVFKTIALVSESRVTVLIQGESGTGKELIARCVHQNSPWSSESFNLMDCSTIVDSLMESELFGYEKGAFTGAQDTRKGRLELTGDGTVFFDEIGELPLRLQSKLLRFLQAREFTRVGGNRPIRSNARIIAATNRDLTSLVQKRKFREDLYYRLKVVTIDVPPLRQRRSDIPLLADFFLQKIAQEAGSPPKQLEPAALKLLMNHDWPGNVRELENVLIRAAVMTRSSVLTLAHTESCLRDAPQIRRPSDDLPTLESVERDHILRVLNTCGWHLGNTCARLGISRPTLRARMRKYGIESSPGAGNVPSTIPPSD
ncbi:response regulator [Candidatus Peregrinibacteria bacterium]|nr:response regulator [Candidatus Peregrinibacteria bacterium]